MNRLSPRERLLVNVALPVALIAAALHLVWTPMQSARAQHLSDIAAYRLVAATAQLAARAPVRAQVPRDNRPVASRITRAADASGLALRRIAPEGRGQRVTLDNAPFAGLILWLATLEQDSGITVSAIEIDRRTEPGMVAARILLEPL